MSNLNQILKEEIGRIARKEIRKELEQLKKNSAQHRRDIANLKRQLTNLERRQSLMEGKVLSKGRIKPVKELDDNVRFNVKGIISQRKRLGLSAADYGLLLGVSPLTIYNWEKGGTRPRKAQLATLVAMRNMGKKEAKLRLSMLQPKDKSNSEG
jgi:DNA-binding transcriptional regulator YiaG